MERNLAPSEKKRKTNSQQTCSSKNQSNDQKRDNRMPDYRCFDEIEDNMFRVGSLFEQLIRKFQPLMHANLDFMEEFYDRGGVSRARIQLAQSIIRNYWSGRLPLIDAIIYTTSLPIGGSYQAYSSPEEFAKWLQYAQGWVESLNLGEESKTAYELAEAKSMLEHIEQMNLIELKVDNTSWPPELPTIKNHQLLQQVFTHRSANAEFHNDRLEFQGDTILNFIVSNVLYDTFPDADEGRLSEWKSRLVCNSNLWKYALAYNFPKRLRASAEVSKRHDIHNKAWGDTFEAYVAAVTNESGISTTKCWLDKLLKPDVDAFSRKDSVILIDKNAKTELYRKIGSAQQKIIYVEKSQNPFVMEARVGNDILGIGKDNNRRLAGLRAAMDALQNHPEKIEEYAAKRHDSDRQAKVTGAMAS